MMGDGCMILRIKSVQPMDNYMLEVTFEDGKVLQGV